MRTLRSLAPSALAAFLACSEATPPPSGAADAAKADATAQADATPDAGPGPDDAALSDDAGTHDDDATAPDAGRTYAEAVVATHWEALPNAPRLTRGKQDDVYFTDAQHGFAVSGAASRIYRTDDGGDTWTTSFTHAGTYFRSLLFVDDQHGFAGNLGPIPGSSITDPVVLYETIDGGDNWTPVSGITGSTPVGICNQTKIDATHLIGVGRVGGPSHLVRSDDGGASWVSRDLGAQLAMLIDARFTSPTEGIVVGGSAGAQMRCTILRTTNGTDFAPVFTSSATDALCWKISFPSARVGYVSIQNTRGGPSGVAKTIDGGETWVELPLTAGAYGAIGIGFITDDIGWVASDDPAQPVLRTLDGGQTWTVDDFLESPINRFRFVDERTAYAIGGRVYKLRIDWP